MTRKLKVRSYLYAGPESVPVTAKISQAQHPGVLFVLNHDATFHLPEAVRDGGNLGYVKPGNRIARVGGSVYRLVTTQQSEDYYEEDS